MKEVEGWKPETGVSCWDGIKEHMEDYYPQGLPKDPIKYQEALVLIYTLESAVYHEMNKDLREDDPVMLHKYAGYINELRNVFETDMKDQIIEPFIGTVYRGIRFPDVN